MSFRSALSHRGFRTLWLGQLASRVGDSIHEIALVWLTYEVTGSPTLLSATFVASFLPTILLSLPAGVVADRMNRVRLLVGSDLLRGAVVLVIPLVGRGPLLVPTIIAVAFVTGVVDAFDGPARGALVPNLVPEDDLDAANSLRELTFSVSQVLFAAGGVVVAVTGSFAAFYADAGSFLVSALLVARISREHGVPDRDDEAAGERDATGDRLDAFGSMARDAVADVRAVLDYVAGKPVLLNLLALGVALQFTIAPINVAAPVYAPRLPFEGSLALGLLYSTFFTGMTAGSLLVGRFDGVVDAWRGPVIVGGLVSFGVALALTVARTPDSLADAALALGVFGVAGVCFAAANVPQTTLAQTLVPDERRGRYFSVAGTLGSLGFVLGLGVTGPLIDLVGARTTLLAVGSLSACIGLVLVTQPLARVGSRRPTGGVAEEPG